MEQPTLIARHLAAAPQVLICSHMQPDGDSLGSMVALGLALEKLNKQVVMLAGEAFPTTYRFLVDEAKVILPDRIGDIPPVAVFLDCTDEERVGENLLDLVKPIPFKINIDHHISNSGFGNLTWVEPAAAAAGELVYSLIKMMNINIDQQIATALYTALATDTGSFQYSNTTAQTHRIAAELLVQGADINEVRENLYETQPPVVLRLLAAVLPTLQLSGDGRVAWLYVTRQVIDQLQVPSEYFERLVGYPKSVAGAEVAMVFRELEEERVKVSLRSKRKVDVNDLAAKFGGGGHQRAAGCTVAGPLAQVIKEVVAAAEEAVAK